MYKGLFTFSIVHFRIDCLKTLILTGYNNGHFNEVCRRQFKNIRLNEWPPINDASLLRFPISDHKLILLHIDQRAVSFPGGSFKNCWYVNKPMYGESWFPSRWFRCHGLRCWQHLPCWWSAALVGTAGGRLWRTSSTTVGSRSNSVIAAADDHIIQGSSDWPAGHARDRKPVDPSRRFRSKHRPGLRRLRSRRFTKFVKLELLFPRTTQ